jgi:hypothetical protein
MTSVPRESAQEQYDRLCDSYHAIDDFRMKLLGLLPVATGTGVFLLLSGKTELIDGNSGGQLPEALGAIGIFGALFTFGLFTYELFGIKKCHCLIEAGKRLEARFGIRGQFRTRPRYAAGFLNEPFASSIIYPASMAAWIFLAVFFTSKEPWIAGLTAAAVFVVGLVATLVGARRIGPKYAPEDQVLEFLNSEPSTCGRLQQELGTDKDLLETVSRLKKRGDIRERHNVLELADTAGQGSSLIGDRDNAAITTPAQRRRWLARAGGRSRDGAGKANEHDQMTYRREGRR